MKSQGTIDLDAEIPPAELQKKLREAGKNASVNQGKVNRLQATVSGMRGKKDIYEEQIRIMNKQLAEKTAELTKLEKLYGETKSRLDFNTKKADNLRTQLAECSRVFSSAVDLTRNTALKSSATTKYINGQYTTGEMESLRGYSCKIGSTFSPRKNKTSLGGGGMK
ncbi:unnamed protein product [Amoebophrya sp. A120]|nr:unnamed protein product [Amoebophrya sp. A120]|eukprot:GSA120T00000927001.1